MLRDPGDAVARASGGEHGRGETPAQRGGMEEDREQSDEWRVTSDQNGARGNRDIEHIAIGNRVGRRQRS